MPLLEMASKAADVELPHSFLALQKASAPFAGLGVAVATVAAGAALVRRSLVARQLRLAGQDQLATLFSSKQDIGLHKSCLHQT